MPLHFDLVVEILLETVFQPNDTAICWRRRYRDIEKSFSNDAMVISVCLARVIHVHFQREQW
jgi:hypothetical protein